jgi:hypothetical protein
LNHHTTNGNAKVVEYNYYNGASGYDEDMLEYEEYFYTTSCPPHGLLFDVPPTQNSEDYSYRPLYTNASAWKNGDPGTSVGVVVVDMCFKPCPIPTIQTFSFFQMISEGLTTGIRISRHPETGGTAPEYPF